MAPVMTATLSPWSNKQQMMLPGFLWPCSARVLELAGVRYLYPCWFPCLVLIFKKAEYFKKTRNTDIGA
jgi:hypothetical protein